MAPAMRRQFMPLSWNEITERAAQFAENWQTEKREDAEAQSFWNDFFDVFGVRRRTVASFEEKVRNIKGQFGFIDLFWRGKMLAEHKSLGQSLDKAASQAFEYIQCLKDEGRDVEIPRYIVVSDFANIVLYDLEADAEYGEPETVKFPLRELHKHIHSFAFIPGYKVHHFKKEDDANIRAAELMGDIHDALAANGYGGHDLEQLLVRILFCLFADDTGIFEPNAFTTYLEQGTREDGGDLGSQLGQLFDVLNTPENKRQKNLDELLTGLRYVNGGLFEDKLLVPACNRTIRNTILAATRFDWSRISPAVFGSLFQSVMNPDARRRCGAHYTSELDILKVIRPLFLDELQDEFKKIRNNRKKLQEFHQKLASLTFLDPACGCGNFLVLAYRELRRLEMEVLQAVYKKDVFDLLNLVQVNVDQFYGIEIIEFPVRIAETALWIMDHQMNVEVTERFGRYFVRLPLQKSPTIFLGNALRIDWNDILPNKKCSYILGNPPYVGKHYRSKEQSADMRIVLPNFSNIGDIDYVISWFFKTAAYIVGTKIKVAFVATNSITQGEQVAVAWEPLQKQYNLQINFAYRTFPWTSEARGKAHVHCVIIGFCNYDLPKKTIFEIQKQTENKNKENLVTIDADYISPYLLCNSKTLVKKRLKPLGNVPKIRCGNKPSDGGFYIFTDAEKRDFLKEEPDAGRFFRRFTGSQEFINGKMRWCLWLQNISPEELRQLPNVMERIKKVRQFRGSSSAEPTRQASESPTQFFYQSQPNCDYILIPETSSERRKYIPMGIVSQKIIASNAAFLIPCNDLFLLGILMSCMHMVWAKTVGGRLESRYRYSGSLIYNTFPFPDVIKEERKFGIKEIVQKILDFRKSYSNSTLADLYDPLTMPNELLKAHRELDRAVDRCYRSKPFSSDQERLAFLFELYEKLTDDKK
jgi:hypothetical protein